jgi:hypothetical protein
MALKRLLTAEMISLSSPWVKDDHDERQALLAIEDTRPVLRRIETAHAGLVAAAEAPAPSAAELALVDELDDAVRGTISLINGSARLQKDKAQREALFKLRDFLFPTGPSAVHRTAREEAGQAEMLKGRLTPPMKALLKSVPSPDDNLLATLQRYFRVAQKLGAAAEPGPPGPASERDRARNRWVRAVTVLIATLEQEDIESPYAGTILERIRQAEGAADRRVESGAPEEDEAD